MALSVFDQPNLFGRCKRAQVQWQFGQYTSTTGLISPIQDPNVFQSRISAERHTGLSYVGVTLIRSPIWGRARRRVARCRLGFPVPNSLTTAVSSSPILARRCKYANNSGTLLSTLVTTCNNCFRSSVGSSRIRAIRGSGLPFPLFGAMQSITANFNGGPLGGTAAFRRYTTELVDPPFPSPPSAADRPPAHRR